MKLKNIVLILIFSCVLALQIPVIAQQNFALVIHGGAGVISKDNMSDAKEQEYLKILEEALDMGEGMLQNGENSCMVVLEVIKLLEDSPLFNAGKGAVFTNSGTNELDASIMEGKNLNAGAITGVKDIKNPIVAAYEVMTNSNHVFLSGEGASEFAKKQGLEMVPNNYFFTESRYQSLQKLLKKERAREEKDNHGTVGCVALDKFGNICAGTSTGGMTNKKYGRIGDSPVIGAGTYADNNTCGVSCTGHGEYYIRLGFAKDIAAQMEYKGLSVEEACKAEIKKLSTMNGTGGVIALDKEGNIAMEFNTSGMYRAYLNADGEKGVAIFKN